MSRHGFKPALIGKDMELISNKSNQEFQRMPHVALVLSGLDKPLDWNCEGQRLIETLRQPKPELSEFGVIISNIRLHIGQPFGEMRYLVLSLIEKDQTVTNHDLIVTIQGTTLITYYLDWSSEGIFQSAKAKIIEPFGFEVSDAKQKEKWSFWFGRSRRKESLDKVLSTLDGTAQFRFKKH